jgi:hypothetical protein
LCLAFALFFFQISTSCLYPFSKSFFLSKSSYNTTFSFSPTTNLLFRMFTFRVKFSIFRLTIAMVLNNLATVFTFIIYIIKSSTNFGVLVFVVGYLDPTTNDCNSCIILLPLLQK